MGKKITLKEFFDSNCPLAIHCDTLEKAIILTSKFANAGKTYCNGDPYEDPNWWQHKVDTCYGNDGTYGNKESYIRYNYDIIEFEDVLLVMGNPKFNINDFVIAHDILCYVNNIEVNISNIVLYELKAVNSLFTFGKVLESNIRKPTLKELLDIKQSIVFKVKDDDEKTKLFKALDKLNILWKSGDRALTFLHKYELGPFVLEWYDGINQYRLVWGTDEDGVIIIDSLDMLLDFEPNDEDVSSNGYKVASINGVPVDSRLDLHEMFRFSPYWYDMNESKFAIKTYLEGEDKMVKIENIYVNEKKRTIVVKWYSGETTKVTCAPDDTWDLEKGVAMAIAKYYLGNDYHAGELFQRYLKKATISASKNTDTKKKTSKNKKASS